ncbi:MAG: class I SAM-dependent methyltransferase [Acidobacteria bacterium]|nr:class I SAM-dependent methyltransferase [Acidobacteriota bacterium]
MSAPDTYTRFTHRFFDRWSPLYDLFAKPIGFAYGAAVRAAGARPGRRILDVCTGTGEIAIRCARRGAEVTAIDLTPSMMARAREKAQELPIVFTLMDARQLEFPDDAFDVALLSFALHDMPRNVRSQVLREAARVTREALVILDYELARGGWRRGLGLRFLELFETPYLRQFSQGGVPAALSDAGLPIPPRKLVLPGLIALRTVPLPDDHP